MKSKSKPFSTRGFVSLLMAFSFAGLAISGIILYVAPPCSIADRTGWTIMALSKVQWASLHQVSAIFILTLAIIHLFVFNWRTFLCYLRNRKSRRLKECDTEEGKQGWTRMAIPAELVAAIIAALILYIGALTLVAPFGWLHDGSDAIKEYYRQTVPSGSGDGYRHGDAMMRGDGWRYYTGDSIAAGFGERSRIGERSSFGEGSGSGEGAGFGERAGSGERAGPGRIAGRGLGYGSGSGYGYRSYEDPGSGSGFGYSNRREYPGHDRSDARWERAGRGYMRAQLSGDEGIDRQRIKPDTIRNE